MIGIVKISPSDQQFCVRDLIAVLLNFWNVQEKAKVDALATSGLKRHALMEQLLRKVCLAVVADWSTSLNIQKLLESALPFSVHVTLPPPAPAIFQILPSFLSFLSASPTGGSVPIFLLALCTLRHVSVFNNPPHPRHPYPGSSSLHSICSVPHELYAAG